MKRVLVVHHTLDPPGGGSAVGAWALQALGRDHAVDVLTWRSPRLDRVNRAFGTALRASDFRWHTVAAQVRAPLEAVPLPLALLTMNLIFREAKRLARRTRYDAILGTINELDVGARAVQYIHYPWAKFPRPDADYRWYHYSGPLRLYRWASARVSGYRKENVTRNLTLVNSDWTGEVYRRYYGASARTVYPPVPGGFPDVPFDRRENGFVCLGRISPEKEVVKLIRILAAVRARGHAVGLHIVGHVDNPAYMREVDSAARPHRDWVSFHHDLSRAALVRLIANNRYGIHGMVGEHFGIAPAELQRAGCLTFVPHDGGPVEIVGNDARLVYRNEAEAIEKIDAVLVDAQLRREALAGLEARRAVFSETRFMDEIRAAVAEVAS